MNLWPFTKKKDPKEEELVSKIQDFAKKYLEEYVVQLEQVNLSDIVALPQLSSSNTFGKKELTLQASIKEAYLKNPTVFACVNAIAKSVAMAPFTLHEKEDEGQYITVFSNPIIDLLENPNETQTRQEFVKTIMVDLLLCGNSLVWKNFDKNKDRSAKAKAGKGVSELIILNPDYIEYTDNGFEITSYQGREKTPLAGNKWDPSQIIHFRLINPSNMFWGLSPIQAAYRSIDIDSKILEWWLNTLENGCKKDALISFKHDLTTAQFQRVRNLIDQQVAGFLNGRGYMILGHEAQVEFLDLAPAELDFTQSRETSSTEIMRIFHVPPPCVGDMQQSTYNNMEEATKTFWLSTVINHLTDVCSVLTKRLVPDFGYDVNKYYIGYDALPVEPLRQLYYDAIDNVVKLVGIGIPLNEATRKLNLQLKDFEGGDVGYMSHNLVPLGFYDSKVDEDTTDTKE